MYVILLKIVNFLIYFTLKTIVKIQIILSKRAMPYKKRIKRAKRAKLWGTSCYTLASPSKKKKKTLIA
jgi:hypothetical protein